MRHWATDYFKFALRMTPMEHQQRVSDALDNSEGQLVYHGLGSGKTFTAINAADKHGLPLIAIVPAALRENMRKEIRNSGFKGQATVISYEEAARLKDDPKFKEQAANSLVAFDEAHRMGLTESARSELASSIPGAKKLFMTGTPIRNHPSELAPLLNPIGHGDKRLPLSKSDFNAKYVQDVKQPVGFFGQLRGIKPGTVQQAKNLNQFRKAIAGKVDYNPSGTSDFPTHDEKIIDVPMSEKQRITYETMMGKYPVMAYKVQHGIPPTKSELSAFQAFSVGPRQIANHPASFNLSATDNDSPKIQRAASEVASHLKKDPNYRGVSYSSYLESGVDPLSRALTARGVPHAIFTGGLPADERKQIINDYNTGKVKHLIISGAGSEGLDLKGTKLMQILEPHWNESRIQQVKGRAIRYKSHAHLPENERHVEVQRFHTVEKHKLNPIQKLFGVSDTSPTIDGYMYDLAKKKQNLNNQFLNVIQEQGAHHAVREQSPAAVHVREQEEDGGAGR